VLAALVERQKTGRGTLVDAALVDSQVGVLANQALNYLVSGIVPKRQAHTPQYRTVSGVPGCRRPHHHRDR
jgi:crotonobetainyl-CoA:carnitine CoA-transferase CaiB-like acyl-CoA transferase